ncbi:MAG: DEAD/DEAH box helicase [Paludibacter sp.]|nr:DEAD/DEAH box helicase [Paludibacter sp.]
MTFYDLGLNENILQSLQENNISEPTDIQLQAIPHILSHDTDLVAVAQTGTGKTAAFCLPILQTIDYKLPKIQALVLVPTRELGQQVAREFFLFSKHLPRVFAEAVYGGAPIDDQIQRLKRTTHVVVATPGRLLDLLDRNALNLQDLKYLVLDEADEMMNMGFKSEIDNILRSCKKGITNMLFTATMPGDVKQIIQDYLRPDFVEIHINAEEFVNQKIEHQYLIYKQGEKLDYLKAYLHERKDQRGIMFCRTKTAAKRLAKQLAGFEVVADALHGNLNQEMRDKVMRGFKKNRINLLVATDIAARGIDVKDLDYIIHYHLPEKAEYYTHRSGRTARAGKSGISVCLIKTEDLPELKAIESDLNIQFAEIGVKLLPEPKVAKPITLYMNMGFGQGFTKNSMADFLVEEAGLSLSDIQNVVVEDNRSYFDVPAKFEQQITINLKGFKLSHRNLKLTLDGERSKRNIY